MPERVGCTRQNADPKDHDDTDDDPEIVPASHLLPSLECFSDESVLTDPLGVFSTLPSTNAYPEGTRIV